MKNKIDEYAFWKYDQYPYLLGGKVAECTQKTTPSTVYVDGYGNSLISFAFILKGKKGENLLAELNELKKWYIEEYISLRRTFNERLLAVLPLNKRKHISFNK